MKQLHKGWLGGGIMLAGILLSTGGLTPYSTIIMLIGSAFIIYHCQSKKNWVGVILSTLLIIALMFSKVRM